MSGITGTQGMKINKAGKHMKDLGIPAGRERDSQITEPHTH